MIVLLASVAWAEAPDALHPGEMYGHIGGYTGNAYTTPKRMGTIHPFIRSSYGVADMVDVKASMLGLIGGPHLNVEVAPVQTDKLAFSLEGGGGTGWGFGWVDYRAIGHFSVRPSDSGMFNLSLGYHGLRVIDSDVIQFDGPPVLRAEVGYDFMLSDYTALVLTARTNVLGWDAWGPHGAVGGYVNYARGTIGLSAGLNLALLGTAALYPEDVAELAELPQLPTTVPIPLPHFQIWFRI